MISNDKGPIGPANLTRINLINANARSLRPKTESLLDNFKEMDIDVAVLTETWLGDSQEDELREQLALGSGLGLLTRRFHPSPVQERG